MRYKCTKISISQLASMANGLIEHINKLPTINDKVRFCGFASRQAYELSTDTRKVCRAICTHYLVGFDDLVILNEYDFGNRIYIHDIDDLKQIFKRYIDCKPIKPI